MTLSHNKETMSISETFHHESQFWQAGYDFVIGIDEAGRGPLAGPVIAAALAWRKFQITNSKCQINFKSEIQNSKQYELIKDSKKLSEKQREGLYDFICENFYVGVGICDHVTIDRINVLEATYLAMKKAIASLVRGISNSPNSSNSPNKIQNFKFQNTQSIILVDGNKTIPNLSMEQKAIIGGDKIVKSISAASIVAKVTRDRIMQEMHEKYPQYGFLKHKGYGTVAHREAIKNHGPCEIHRKSFRLV